MGCGEGGDSPPPQPLASPPPSGRAMSPSPSAWCLSRGSPGREWGTVLGRGDVVGSPGRPPPCDRSPRLSVETRSGADPPSQAHGWPRVPCSRVTAARVPSRGGPGHVAVGLRGAGGSRQPERSSPSVPAPAAVTLKGRWGLQCSGTLGSPPGSARRAPAVGQGVWRPVCWPWPAPPTRPQPLPPRDSCACPRPPEGPKNHPQEEKLFLPTTVPPPRPPFCLLLSPLSWAPGNQA